MYCVWTNCLIITCRINVTGMMHIKVVDKIKVHILCSKLVSKNRTIYELMYKKFCSAEQARHDNMAHEHCMLDTEDYKHTLRIYIYESYCNTVHFRRITSIYKPTNAHKISHKTHLKHFAKHT